jgi:hypothetical protein
MARMHLLGSTTMDAIYSIELDEPIEPAAYDLDSFQ